MNKAQKFALQRIIKSYDELLKRFRTTRRTVIWERSTEWNEDTKRLNREINQLKKKRDFWLKFLK